MSMKKYCRKTVKKFGMKRGFRGSDYVRPRPVAVMEALDRWRLWKPPTGGGYGCPRPVTVMAAANRWRLWPSPTGGGYGRPQPVAVMAVPDRWRLWPPPTGGGYGRPRSVAVVLAAGAAATTPPCDPVRTGVQTPAGDRIRCHLC
jgi:hypothetical protein